MGSQADHAFAEAEARGLGEHKVLTTLHDVHSRSKALTVELERAVHDRKVLGWATHAEHNTRLLEQAIEAAERFSATQTLSKKQERLRQRASLLLKLRAALHARRWEDVQATIGLADTSDVDDVEIEDARRRVAYIVDVESCLAEMKRCTKQAVIHVQAASHIRACEVGVFPIGGSGASRMQKKAALQSAMRMAEALSWESMLAVWTEINPDAELIVRSACDALDLGETVDRRLRRAVRSRDEQSWYAAATEASAVSRLTHGLDELQYTTRIYNELQLWEAQLRDALNTGGMVGSDHLSIDLELLETALKVPQPGVMSIQAERLMLEAELVLQARRALVAADLCSLERVLKLVDVHELVSEELMQAAAYAKCLADLQATASQLDASLESSEVLEISSAECMARAALECYKRYSAGVRIEDCLNDDETHACTPKEDRLQTLASAIERQLQRAVTVVEATSTLEHQLAEALALGHIADLRLLLQKAKRLSCAPAGGRHAEELVSTYESCRSILEDFVHGKSSVADAALDEAIGSLASLAPNDAEIARLVRQSALLRELAVALSSAESAVLGTFLERAAALQMTDHPDVVYFKSFVDTEVNVCLALENLESELQVPSIAWSAEGAASTEMLEKAIDAATALCLRGAANQRKASIGARRRSSVGGVPKTASVQKLLSLLREANDALALRQVLLSCRRSQRPTFCCDDLKRRTTEPIC